MNIVFIVGNYYPYYSAVGRCVGNIADELIKTNKVMVICQKDFKEQKDIETLNGQGIIRISTKENELRNKLKKGIEYRKGLVKETYKLLLNIYKLLRIVKIIFSKVTIRKNLVDSYLSALNKIDETIDLIIPSSMPIESVVAANNYKNDVFNDVKIMPYLFDQFVDSDTLHRSKINRKLKRDRHINLEMENLMHAHAILAMHSLNKHFATDLPQLKKIIYIEHPLIFKYDQREYKNDGEIKISYIGGLYKNYVDPDYLLKLFSKINNKEMVLHFYIVGNCYNIVNKYCSCFPNKIINHGSVDKVTANNEISNSNILISIAEKRGIQMSSKIFEYMSYGKPIIHLYTDDNDVNLKILKKYPLSMCLKQEVNQLNKNVISFVNFCRKSLNSYVPYEEVERLYYDATPKYTSDLIMRLLADEKYDL